MNPELHDFHVLVLGGGIVGATTACALARGGLRVGVIERRLPPENFDPDHYGQRVSAITRASEQIFRGLGVWNAIVARRVAPFREMHVWDAAGGGSIHFDSANLGEEALGYIVENQVMQTALFTRLRDLPQAVIYCPATPTQLRIDNSAATLTLDDGRLLRAALIVLGWLYWPGWWVSALLALAVNRGRLAHPRVIDAGAGLDRTRRIVGWLVVALLVLCFMPAPVSVR